MKVCFRETYTSILVREVATFSPLQLEYMSNIESRVQAYDDSIRRIEVFSYIQMFSI